MNIETYANQLFRHDEKSHIILLQDTLKKCLQKDPSNRPEAEALLQHPYLRPTSFSGVEEGKWQRIKLFFLELQFMFFSSFQSVSKLSEQDQSNEKSNKHEVQKSYSQSQSPSMRKHPIWHLLLFLIIAIKITLKIHLRT